MKNLKKVLSLVLALAMALSLMTAAFAADASDYKDYSKVTYKEAVDVMTAAGIDVYKRQTQGSKGVKAERGREQQENLNSVKRLTLNY